MANTAAKKSPAKKTAAEKAAVSKAETKTNEPVVEEKKEYRVRQVLDPNTIVTVRNGFQGRLIYISKKTGEQFDWAAFGDEQDMELGELKSARNNSKKFFINNWFMLDDPEIIEYLGVQEYYKDAIPIDEFDDLFVKAPDEIIDIVSKLSKGQRKSVAYRARRLIANKQIDSLRVIDALEKSLNIELIEK